MELDRANHLIARLESLAERVEAILPPPPPAPDFGACLAFRWRRGRRGGYLEGVRALHRIGLADLQGIERQKAELDRNTRQFVAGHPANNALLWGSRGTGKSSLVKALVNEYADRGLRVVEVDKTDLIDLPEIIDALTGRPERFVLFCDDLSFEADDPSYKALKAVLDGSVHAPPDNIVLYATSNRRHLLPEYMSENQQAQNVNGEIHHGDTVEEKISLSERFGLWLSFYPFKQDEYLDIVGHWVRELDGEPAEPERMRADALRWALARGSRSGRSAWQFARDWVGRNRIARAGDQP
ncbi:MAG: ATP-binding protein [Ectothiorhodospiraceae bacterium]|nr:ATP-binding protein [Chromatiales bacterium]MCP5155694.1 ATP-binding protein [Ectothiorhodospiraceae bacterium]